MVLNGAPSPLGETNAKVKARLWNLLNDFVCQCVAVSHQDLTAIRRWSCLKPWRGMP